MTTNTGKMTSKLRSVTLIITAALVIFAISCSSASALSFEMEYSDYGTVCIYDEEQECYVNNDAYHEALGYVYDDIYGEYVCYDGDTVSFCDCEVCEYVREGNEVEIPDDGWLLAEEGQEDDGGDDEDAEEYEDWTEDEETVDECDWDDEELEDDEDWVVEECGGETEAETDPFYTDTEEDTEDTFEYEETVIEDESDEYAEDETPITKAEKTEYVEDTKVVEKDTKDTKTKETSSAGNNSKDSGYGVAEVAPEGADESESTGYSVSESPVYSGTESTGYTEDDTTGYYEDEPTEDIVTDPSGYEMPDSIDYDTEESTNRLSGVDTEKAKFLATRGTMILSAIAGLIAMIRRRLNGWR